MSTEHELYPLSAFCVRDNIALPPYRIIDADDLPEPFRQLLDHKRDMTSVLQDFHSQKVHLENVDIVREDDHLMRRVALLAEDGRPVEFGAIDIWLSRFTDEVQQVILECRTPFGAILNENNIAYTSSPKRFFEIDSIDFIGVALGLESSARLYGRTNILRSEDGQIMARVVEILPPAAHGR